MTKSFSQDEYARALAGWHWLDVHAKTPVLASVFGDIFLQDRHGYWFLDTIEGTLTRPWSTRDEVQASLESEEGQDRYLLAGLAFAASDSGLVLGPPEVYAFSVPPRLGGPFDVGNICVMDFVVAVDIAAQIHEQVKDLPPGTTITGVTFDDTSP